jgi:hypothetical protein
MSHVFEVAPTGRAKCRGCNQALARGEIRFGERLANPFAEGEMTLWFHPRCAAFKRPEPLLEALPQAPESLPERAELERVARAGLTHRRRPRIDGAERAPSGQAKCRSCREPIAKGTWRIRLVFYEEGRFSPGGFVHLACRAAYFETSDLWEPLAHFSADLGEDERKELEGEVRAATPPP